MTDYSDLVQRLRNDKRLSTYIRSMHMKDGFDPSDITKVMDEAADAIEILEGTINGIFAKLAAHDRAMDKIRSLLYKGPYEPIELSDADKDKWDKLFKKAELEIKIEKALEEQLSRNNGIVN